MEHNEAPVLMGFNMDYVLKNVETRQTAFEKIKFLKSQIEFTNIEKGLAYYENKCAPIPEAWLGVLYGRGGESMTFEDELKQDAFDEGVSAWRDYCTLMQWINDVENGKKLEYPTTQKPSRRNALIEAHKVNGGRLTSEQVKEVAIKYGYSVKATQTFYGEIIDDIK